MALSFQWLSLNQVIIGHLYIFHLCVCFHISCMSGFIEECHAGSHSPLPSKPVSALNPERTPSVWSLHQSMWVFCKCSSFLQQFRGLRVRLTVDFERECARLSVTLCWPFDGLATMSLLQCQLGEAPSKCNPEQEKAVITIIVFPHVKPIKGHVMKGQRHTWVIGSANNQGAINTLSKVTEGKLVLFKLQFVVLFV